jgi:DNA-directed RNA polymerase beta' subunit
MKRNILIIAAFVGSLLFASCGDNKDALVKQTDDMFTQAETDLQGIDNLDDFFAFRAEMDGKKDNLIQQIMDTYGISETEEEIPEEVEQILDRAYAYNEKENVKYEELLTPLLESMENAIANGDKEAAQEAYTTMLKYSEYDLPSEEVEERCANIIAGLRGLGVIEQ